MISKLLGFTLSYPEILYKLTKYVIRLGILYQPQIETISLLQSL